MGCQESRAVWKTGESREKTGQQEPRLGVGVSTGHHYQAKKFDRVWLEVRSLISQDLWVTRPKGGIAAEHAERAFIHLFIEDEKLIKAHALNCQHPLLQQQVRRCDEPMLGKEAKFCFSTRRLGSLLQGLPQVRKSVLWPETHQLHAGKQGSGVGVGEDN